MRLLDKVRAVIEKRELLGAGETVLVAVSGGPDSLALLDILRTLRSEFKWTLHVAHLNHLLRAAESDEDARFVSDLARGWGLACTVEARPVAEYARTNRLSLEEAARVIRYQFLAETAGKVGATEIALGHNSDDQVETVLMHLLRGSGLAGMRGMLARSPLSPEYLRPGQPPLYLVRPLLAISRSEIEAYCAGLDLHPRRDSSNAQVTPFRNRLRLQIIPELLALNPNLREVLVHTAETIADDYEVLSVVVRDQFERVARKSETGWVFDRRAWLALPPSLQRATLRQGIRRLNSGLRNINWVHIDDARRVADTGRAGARATLPGGLALIMGYEEFTLGREEAVPDWPLLFTDVINLDVGEPQPLPSVNWQVSVEPIAAQSGSNAREEDRWGAVIDGDKVKGSLYLRARRPGDRFQPGGMAGHGKSLHDFLINSKVPRATRDHLPLLCDEEKIVWVCGFRLDERVRVGEDTRRALRIRFAKS